MGTASSILVISNRQEDILNFRSKLVLLRDIDSIIGSTIDKAVESCRKYIPDTVIVFVEKKDEKLFEICKAIRLDSILKNTPIIFIFNSYNEELLLSSFDAGISDYVIFPARETEILIKVIWCLKKSEMARDLDKKEALLRDLGVMDKGTGAYTPEFISRVFTNEINTAKKYRFPVVLMAISLDLKHKNKINDNYLASVIKKSIRNSDAFGVPENGKFYLILPKTGVKGACTVYERISKNLSKDLSISAGLCESFKGMTYEVLGELSLDALNEALSRGGNRIIVSDKAEKIIESVQKASKQWLDKVETNKKDYEAFKEEFSKKVNSIISPVFHKVQNDLRQKYSAKFIVEQFVTDTKCYFSVKEPYENREALVKILDPGLSKVIVEKVFAREGKPEIKRASLEIADITEENVLKILKNLFIEFQKQI